MLRPSKHSHPDKTVINAALIILSRLKQCKVNHCSDLLHFLQRSISDGGVLFLPALNFLFLMGVIKYHPQTDLIQACLPETNHNQ